VLGLRSRSVGVLASVAAIFLLALGGGRAAAGDAPSKKTASLGWSRLEGADGCIATRDLAQGVEKLLGRSALVSASQADLAIEGRIEKRAPGPGYHATLTVSSSKGDPLGSRELSTESSDCRALDAEVELAVALMIDPEAALAPPTAAPSASASAPPVVSAPPTASVTAPPARTVYVPVPAPPPPPAPEPWRGDLAAGVAVGFGHLPEVSPGVVIAGSLEPPWLFPLEGTLTFFPPVGVDLVRGARVELMAFEGAGFACPIAYREDVWSIRVCGGLQGGFLAVSSTGFDVVPPDENGLRGTLGAGVRGRVDFRIVGPLGVAFAADFMVPFIRDQLVYRKPGGAEANVFQVAPVTGALDGFATLQFP
jgi:hypothetical protein